MEKYLKLKENGQKATHLKIELHYSLGGYNYFSYKPEPRGYYLHVTPVERQAFADGGYMEGFMAFSGIKQCIKEVKRKSAKAEAEAEAIAPLHEQELIDYVLNKNGLELEAEAA